MSRTVAITKARAILAEYQAKHSTNSNTLVILKPDDTVPTDLKGGLYLILNNTSE